MIQGCFERFIGEQGTNRLTQRFLHCKMCGVFLHAFGNTLLEQLLEYAVSRSQTMRENRNQSQVVIFFECADEVNRTARQHAARERK